MKFFGDLPSAQRRWLVRKFILTEIDKKPEGVVARVVEQLGISRQAVHRQLKGLVDDGFVDVSGATKGRTYKLRVIDSFQDQLLVDGLQEDKVWEEQFRPRVQKLATNVQKICFYGFTEMLNNVIDHSESPSVIVQFSENALRVELALFDSGVGIFNKIQKACKLETPRIAMFELTKGKFTTDPSRHTGEGIFFTSRVFDSFAIMSGSHYLSHMRDGGDWLLESRPSSKMGTAVFMAIDPASTHTFEEVVAHYATEQDDYAFNRTTIAIKLAASEGEQLVSRSQAKRVAARLDKFREVYLDFNGVESIGPAFADEIFRVFNRQHPHVELIPINANEDVTRMIRRAIAGGADAIQS